MNRIMPGTVVEFLRDDGKVMTDVVREVIWQDNVLPPRKPAAAVTLAWHSWCWMSQLVAVHGRLAGS